MDQISTNPVLQTDRLVMRRVTVEDAPFILELLNEPSWLRFIGDKNVHSLADARNYILKGPIAMYKRSGFGLYLTELKDGAIPIGLCGLIRREGMDDVDIGFAFLPLFWGNGYGLEAASAVLKYGKEVLGIQRIVAITSADNQASIRLCENLGLKFQRMMRLPHEDVDIKLFV